MPSSYYSSDPYYLFDNRMYDNRTIGGPGYRRQQQDRARETGNAPTRREIDEYINYYGSNYSGRMKPDEEALFMAMFGDGSFHGGNIGGVDRQYSGGVMNEYKDFTNIDSPFGNRWLNEENPLMFKEGGTMGMGAAHPEDIVGDKVKFKRDVSPYMMYHHPNDPTMWDEIPDPATPMPGEAGMHPEHMADPYREKWGAAYRKDTMEDLWRIAQRDRSRGNDTLSDILSRQQSRIDEMRRKRSRRW